LYTNKAKIDEIMNEYFMKVNDDFLRRSESIKEQSQRIYLKKENEKAFMLVKNS